METLIFQICILLFSVIVHEVSHGVVAFMLGDPTAKYLGRLTFNPIKHIDLFGSILLPLILFLGNSPFLFGYAKPVPYNPYNLRAKTYGSLLVGAAGPGVNIMIAAVFGFAIRLLGSLATVPPFVEALIPLFGYIVFINLFLGIFNLVPIPPIDGSKIVYPFLPRFIKQTLGEMSEQLRRISLQYGFFFFMIFFLILFQILPYITGLISVPVLGLYEVFTGTSARF